MLTKKQARGLLDADWQLTEGTLFYGDSLSKSEVLEVMVEKDGLSLTARACRIEGDFGYVFKGTITLKGVDLQGCTYKTEEGPFTCPLPLIYLLSLFSAEAWLCHKLWGRFAPDLLKRMREDWYERIAQERRAKKEGRERIARDIDHLVG